ncbi:hypothetical protein EDB92DRAFT_2014485 [Lactarius akahatsu]|uniref:Uncharacterized protein n=1 Tax=Lactarius akahatsu TaxID=416441 RepID=A0AAD4LE89_9AGAM|nr:hypothetical protein EDB92DRAFT_2014485 [Lactarius akahatsu]
MTRPPPLAFSRVVKANQFVFRGSNCLIGRPKGMLSSTYGGAGLCLGLLSVTYRDSSVFTKLLTFVSGFGRPVNSFGGASGTGNRIACVRGKAPGWSQVGPKARDVIIMIVTSSVSSSGATKPRRNFFFSVPSRCCNTQQWERRGSSHPKRCIYESFVGRISYDVWIGINDNISELRINGTLSLQGRYCKTGFRIELKRRLCPRLPHSTRRPSPSSSSSRCQLGTVEVQLAGSIPGTLMVPVDSARDGGIGPRKYIQAHMRCNKETPMDSLRLERSQIK